MCFWNFHISVVWVYRRIQSSDGIPAVVSSYTANELNQYTSRTVPGTLPVTGDAPTNVNVYVNGALADRQRTHWHGTVTADNTQSPAYAQVEAVYLPPDPSDPDEYTATTNRVFFAQSPEVFEYDLDGNMTKDGRFNYSWNGENRLIKAETRDDLPLDVPRYRIEYAYDHQGRMVFKEVFDVSNHYLLTTTHYTWDGWNIIAETVPPLTPSSLLPATSFYVWGLDLSGTLQEAGGVGGLLAVIKDDGIYRPCYDANGNITEYVDTNGVIIAHREYDAFGNTVAATGAAGAFTHWFSTKPWCEVTHLIEYLFRHNSPSLGRWLSRDPLESENRYVFVDNDALSYYDVLGLFKSGGPESKCRGHKDMPGSKYLPEDDPDHGPFDYALEDEDPKTAPIPFTGAPENHFQPPANSAREVSDAISICDFDAFQRAMHRYQDAFSHYNKGYEWKPGKAGKRFLLGGIAGGIIGKSKRGIIIGGVGSVIIGECMHPVLGHGWDSIRRKDPDGDNVAFNRAARYSRVFFNRWNSDCCKCGDKWNVRSTGPCDE